MRPAILFGGEDLLINNMSTGLDRGGPQRAFGGDSTALSLVFAAFAWGILIILAAMTVPVVTVAAAPVTATAPPTLGTTATPTLTPNGQQLFESPVSPS